jgi:alpha-1,2-mannosyltransferase
MGRGNDEEPVSVREIPFVVWTCLWLVGGSFAAVLIVKDLIWTPLNTHIGRDFTNLWTAGKLVLDGRAWWAFDLDLFRLALVEFVRMPSLQNYSYPPHALFLDAPFALLPYFVALALWSVLGAAFFVWAAKPYLLKGFPPFLAALTPAGCINLWAGHYGLLLGGLWLLFFRWYESHPTRAGVAAAMLTIKPHMGLAIAYTALRKRKVLLPAVIATLALILLSALVFGPQTWGAFIFNTTSAQATILNRAGDDSYFRMMPSAYVTWHRGMVAIAAHLAVILATAALLWKYRRWDAFIAATVTFLAIPYVFNYDLTVVCLGAVLLMYKYWDELELTQKLVLGAAFLSPNLTFVWPVAWVTPLALLGYLALQLRFAEREALAKAPPELAVRL